MATVILYAVEIAEMERWVGSRDATLLLDAKAVFREDEEAEWDDEELQVLDRLLERMVNHGQLYEGLGEEETYYLTQLLIDLFDEFVESEAVSDEMPLDAFQQALAPLRSAGKEVAQACDWLIRGRLLGTDRTVAAERGGDTPRARAPRGAARPGEQPAGALRRRLPRDAGDGAGFAEPGGLRLGSTRHGRQCSDQRIQLRHCGYQFGTERRGVYLYVEQLANSSEIRRPVGDCFGEECAKGTSVRALMIRTQHSQRLDHQAKVAERPGSLFPQICPATPRVQFQAPDRVGRSFCRRGVQPFPRFEPTVRKAWLSWLCWIAGGHDEMEETDRVIVRVTGIEKERISGAIPRHVRPFALKSLAVQTGRQQVVPPVHAEGSAALAVVRMGRLGPEMVDGE
jgi:hypothetical protein